MKNKWFYIAIIIPGLIVLLMITAYPTLLTFIYSMTNMHLYFPHPQFLGLENYKEVLSFDSKFYQAFYLDIIWTVVSVGLQLVFAMIGALALEAVKKGTTIFRVLMIVPWTFPSIALAFTWQWILEPSLGIFNYFLMGIGIIDVPIGWFGSPSRAMLSVIAMNVWFGIPFIMVTIIAGLQTISRELYEAADIDGANGWQSFWNITLPSLKNVIIISLVLRSIWTFNNFAFIFMTTGGGPAYRTTILPVLIYRIGWTDGWLGKASAVAVIALALMLVGALAAIKMTAEERK